MAPSSPGVHSGQIARAMSASEFLTGIPSRRSSYLRQAYLPSGMTDGLGSGPSVEGGGLDRLWRRSRK